LRFIANIKVLLKDGVLDPQGETIGRAFHDLGFIGVLKTSTGKLFKLEIEAETEIEARRIAAEAASKLLANPIIERYEVEVVR
jgi:phosphoribosylformylglycinamidine synthase PurS subunit